MSNISDLSNQPANVIAIVSERGTLPDAPMAMPAQPLETPSRGWSLLAILRPGRQPSRGH